MSYIIEFPELVVAVGAVTILLVLLGVASLIGSAIFDPARTFVEGLEFLSELARRSPSEDFGWQKTARVCLRIGNCFLAIVALSTAVIYSSLPTALVFLTTFVPVFATIAWLAVEALPEERPGDWGSAPSGILRWTRAHYTKVRVFAGGNFFCSFGFTAWLEATDRTEFGAELARVLIFAPMGVALAGVFLWLVCLLAIVFFKYARATTHRYDENWAERPPMDVEPAAASEASPRPRD